MAKKYLYLDTATGRQEADDGPAAGGGGDLVLIATQTATAGASSLIFDDVFTADYDLYEIVITNWLPQTNDVFPLMTWRSAGSDVTGGTHGTSLHYAAPNNAFATVGINSTAGHVVFYANAGNGSGHGTFAHMRTWPRSTINKVITMSGLRINNGGSVQLCNAISYLANTTAMTGCKFQFSSGNIAAGTVAIYGYAKS